MFKCCVPALRGCVGFIDAPGVVLFRFCGFFDAGDNRENSQDGQQQPHVRLVKSLLLKTPAPVIYFQQLVLNIAAARRGASHLAFLAGAASAQEAVYPRYGYAPHGYVWLRLRPQLIQPRLRLPSPSPRLPSSLRRVSLLENFEASSLRAAWSVATLETEEAWGR